MDSDYYSTVYTWFERCGIVSHIRTYLRQNLVNALKNKDISLTKENRPKSAKQYVYDLLIAEYLFNVNYAYTLSVFASEAPLLINFHNYKSECADGPDKVSKQKLQNDYVSHTLETIGIRPEDPDGRHIISKYTNSDLPLLLCILKYIPIAHQLTYEHRDLTDSRHVRNMQTQTDITFVTNIPDVKDLVTVKRKMLRQKQSFDKYLRERETLLKERAITMERQAASLNEKLKQIQQWMHSVTAREKELNKKKQNDAQSIYKKEVELSFKQTLLTQEADRLQKERECCKKFESDLKRLQDELVKVQKELPSGQTDGIFSTREMHVQTDFESYTARCSEVRNLQKEKLELSSLVREQQRRIEHLTLRTVHLSRQLEEMNLMKSATINVPPKVSNVNANTIISESSSTEDILQDARMRLKRLEEESLKANQYYYSCIATSP